MSDRLPWFRCFPSALLGALAGLDADEGIVYVTALLRIYETGAPVGETARTLGRRTGLSERKAGAALERLFEAGKLILTSDGKLDSASTHAEIGWQRERHQDQSAAGRASAARRQMQAVGKKNDAFDKSSVQNDGKKTQQNQRNGSTAVELPFNHLEEDTDQKKDKPSSVGDAPTKAVSQKSPRGSFLSTEWQPSDEGWAFAISELGDEPLARRELMKFRNYWFGRSGENGRKRNWDATWQNWVMKEADNGSGHRNRGVSGSSSSGGRSSGTVNASVSTAVARHAARLGIGPGGREDDRGSRDARDHRPRRDDPKVEDADWTPADRHYAAH